METRFNNSNSYISEQQEEAHISITDSPRSSVFNIDTLVTSTSSPRKRKAVQKRVVQIPIKDIEGSPLKGESSTPPSDSWAWRKYGQKPIKGSPYPRGYYRCSSSKCCPARKQVEKSRVDPTILVVTYSCEHNHPCPALASRNNNHNNSITTANKNSIKPELQLVASKTDPEPEEKFADLGEEFGLLRWMDVNTTSTTSTTTSSNVLESSILTGNEADMASILLPMREEDELLFADLGELPECSVFEREEERRRCTAPWCGTTT